MHPPKYRGLFYVPPPDEDDEDASPILALSLTFGSVAFATALLWIAIAIFSHH